jgi:hypothetical protein
MSLASRMIAQPVAVRRACAVVTLVVTLLVASGLVYAIGWIATSQARWRAETGERLVQLRSRAATIPSLRDSLATVDDAPVWNRFYRVAVGADGGGLVHRDVAALCSEVGATVLSAKPLPSRDELGIAKHGVRISASMTADQLRDIVVRLRERVPYLRVEELIVTAPQNQAPDANPILTVTMELFGYARGSEP